MRNIILAVIVALMGIAAPIKAIATVSNSTNQVIYNGDGVTTTFAFSFNVYNSSSENDLLVSEKNTTTGAVTNLTLNTDYTVSLTHATPSPGTITLTTAAASGISVSILRQMPLTQLVTEADNSVTPASVRNNVYDRGVMTAQQLQQQLTRAILQNVFATTSISLPAAVANYNLCWDSTATTLSNCAALSGSIAVPISNSNLQTLTTANLVNGSSLFGTGALTSLTTTGNVGIGSSAPGSILDVQGTIRDFNGNIGINTASPGQRLDVQGTVRALFFSGPANSPYVKCTNNQTSGTNGGTATSGAWRTIPLTASAGDCETDTKGIATLVSNQITLPAGTYHVLGSSPFYVTKQSQIRLQNITDTSLILTGSVAFAQTTSSDARAVLVGNFTINGTKTIEFQYQVNTTEATDGLGTASSFGTEVYAVLEFTKIN